MLQNHRLPYLLHDVANEELSNPDKIHFGSDVVENVFVFMLPDGSCTAKHVLVSYDASVFPYEDGKIKTDHIYELRHVSTFFKDDMFSEFILGEFTDMTRLASLQSDNLHVTTVDAFVASDEELPMGAPIMIAFTPDIFDHYYLERTFDMIDALLEYTEPMVITVNGVEYDALFYDSRLSPEQREALGTLKSVHIYETRHDDNGNWVDPVTVRKEGIHVVVNYCGVIFTIEEIPFPDEDEINIDNVESLIYKTRPGGEGDEE